MKKTDFLLLVFGLLGSFFYAQVTNEGFFVTRSGVQVIIKNLDFINKSSGVVDMDGVSVLRLGGAVFQNDGSFGDLAKNYSVYFDGTVDQEIVGSNEPFFDQLYIDQSGNVSVTQKINISANSISVNDAGNLFDYRVQDPAGSGLRLTADAFHLNGNIRLFDDSQVLQNSTSIITTGTGKIYRDQMGTGDKYWYNYWSSPVNINGSWQVQNLMDGRDPENPQPIVFDYAYTATGSPNVNASQNPAHLNEAWIYTFPNLPPDYLNWQYAGSTGTINIGEGYTMKGPHIKNAVRPGASGSNTEFKAYTFAGTPNGGTYTFSIDGGNIYLLGNPYLSALDIDDFINDNSGQFNGALYFWEHVSGTSHYLTDYGGGYATRNLTGGVPARDWQTNNSVGTKTPGRYVPVAQGFFIWKDNSGTGTINFKNTQRDFVKEDGSNSVFMRSNLTDIRIFFDNRDGLRRHLLLGIRPQVTMNEDWGWDARSFDNDIFAGDMFFSIGGKDFVIQAIPEIIDETRIPLHVAIGEDGEVHIGLISLQNVPDDMQFYIEDAQAGQIFPIDLNQAFSTYLQRGDYHDRFYLVLRPGNTTKVEDLNTGSLQVYYSNGMIYIKNPDSYMLHSAHLFDLNGKSIKKVDLDTNESQIRIPVSLATGIYIIKINWDNKTGAKKILVE